MKYLTKILILPFIILLFFKGYYSIIEINLFLNTIKVNDEFYFAPFEDQEDYVLHKDPLIYSENISLAYWNSDSLVF